MGKRGKWLTAQGRVGALNSNFQRLKLDGGLLSDCCTTRLLNFHRKTNEGSPSVCLQNPPLSCQNISGTTSHDDNADDEVVRDVYYEKRLYPASHTRKRYLGLAPHSVTASKYSTQIPKIWPQVYIYVQKILWAFSPVLMLWSCWCSDAADALILLMSWCCWCTDPADELILLTGATESRSGSAGGPFWSILL